MKLMKLQQEELDSLKRWLSTTEERIAAMSTVGCSLAEVQEQLKEHRTLQKDLENEQSTISSLSNMVVVVDDPASDAAYTQLEDELTALGEASYYVYSIYPTEFLCSTYLKKYLEVILVSLSQV